MSRAIDVALISALALVVMAKLLAIPPAIGIPLIVAGGIANGWRLFSAERGSRPAGPDQHPESH